MNSNDNKEVILASNEVSSILKNKPWFRGIECDKFNNIVVFVSEMSPGIMQEIPEKSNKLNVKVHLDLSKKKYIDVIDLTNGILRSKIAALSNLCGIEVIEDLLFEKHNGNKAETNYKAKWLFVYDRISKLYDEFGFETLDKELEAFYD